MTSTFSRLLKLCAGLLFCGALWTHAKPNFVFILADDMNRDSWGAYGSTDCKTPHIDQLARDGMRFDRAYCSVAMCAPFRQELYSGRSPWRTGTLHNHSKSSPETKSIPHYLKPLGYRVALLGKSHVGPVASYPFEYIAGGNKSQDLNTHYLEKTKGFIDSCNDGKKPFCLFIASNDSHAPFTTGDQSAYHADKLTILPYWLDTPELRAELVKYYAEVSNFDSLVGLIRGELEARKLWQNTLFVVCSEQGTQLPFAKWTCYDNGLHTGMVAHWAGVTTPGSVIQELVATADIAPTFLEAAGGSIQEGDFDGKSFLKTLHGEQQVLRDYVYGAFTNCNIIDNRQRIYPIRVIRDKSFSLLYNPNHGSVTSNVTLTTALNMIQDGKEGSGTGASWVSLSRKDPSAKALVRKLHHRPEYELYNRANDPYELKNEIDNPEYRVVAERLQKSLHRQLKRLGDTDPIETEKKIIAGKTVQKAKPKKGQAKK